MRGETLVVTVHGTARPLDIAGADSDFGAFLRSHYGDDTYDGFLAEGSYYAIDADRLFAADMSAHTEHDHSG